MMHMSITHTIRDFVLTVLIAAPLALAAGSAVAESPKSVVPTAEFERLEKEIQEVQNEFLKAQYDKVKFSTNLTLAVLAVMFSVLGFFGLTSIKDAKKTIEKLELEAKDHLATINEIREATSSWSTEMETAIDDISGLREQLAELRTQFVEVNPKFQVEPTKETLEGAQERMLDALSSGKYLWRSIDRLASIGGVSVEEASRLLRPLTDAIVFSRRKSGQTIVRLKSRTG